MCIRDSLLFRLAVPSRPPTPVLAPERSLSEQRLAPAVQLEVGGRPGAGSPPCPQRPGPQLQ
eukprot:585328-Prorocentrum_lima.AAC.1